MFKKFIPCRKCRAKPNSPIPDGYFQSEVEQNGFKYKVVKECEHHKIWKNIETSYNEYLSSGFDGRYFEYTFDEYKGNLSKKNLCFLKGFVDKFPTDKKTRSVIMYFFGPNGTQKTTIANYIGKEIISHQYTVNLLTMGKLIDKLWASERDEEIKSEIEKLLSLDYLILDEAFDKQKAHIFSGGQQMGLVDGFIRERIHQSKGILFVSNTDPLDIEKEGFTHSIKDLVNRELKKYNSLFTWNDNYMANAEVEGLPPEYFDGR